MSFNKKFINYIHHHHLFTKNDALLVAVSGGCDSTVLAYLLKNNGFNITIAHCNFQLRAAESDRDEEFVQKLAKDLEVPIYIKKFDTKQYELEHQLNTQVAARNLRYDWFTHLINEKTNTVFDFIITAHHANDSIETVLMNFFKGTSIAGLHGILPKQQKIIRPLLFASRKEIENYATENNIPFITDSSNCDSKYSRNFIRNEVLPLLEQKYPHIATNILNNIERFNDVEVLYNDAITEKIKKIVEPKNKELHIPIFKLLKEKTYKTILFEIVKPFSFTSTQLDEIIKLCKADNSSFINSITHQIIKNRNWLIITPKHNAEAEIILLNKEDTNIDFAIGKLLIEKDSTSSISADQNIALLNAAKLEFPLILRPWKTGDYFYPLGMLKKKKVARFLIDLKLSKTEKEKIWVLESNQKIIWVVGYRIDERYKVMDEKMNYLFTFKRG